MVSSANSISNYSNIKIIELLDFKFRTINQSVKDVAAIFNSDFNAEK